VLYVYLSLSLSFAAAETRKKERAREREREKRRAKRKKKEKKRDIVGKQVGKKIFFSSCLRALRLAFHASKHMKSRKMASSLLS